MAKPLPLPPPLPWWLVVARGGVPFEPPSDAGGGVPGFDVPGVDVLDDDLLGADVLCVDASGAGLAVEGVVLVKGVAVSLVESFKVFGALAPVAGVVVLLAVLAELALVELVLLAFLPRRRERLFFAPFCAGAVEPGVLAASPHALSEAGGVLVDAAVSVVTPLS